MKHVQLFLLHIQFICLLTLSLISIGSMWLEVSQLTVKK